jgi:hypothetical protein
LPLRKGKKRVKKHKSGEWILGIGYWILDIGEGRVYVAGNKKSG